jgi:type III pantothenate kinase
MVLAIDIGNSNIVIGCFDRDSNGILFIERLSTNQNSTAIEYTILIKNILELNNFSYKDIDGIIISSVVPSVTYTMKDAMIELTEKPVMVVGHNVEHGLNIKIDNPLKLGSDRIADAVAAIANYSCPLIIVDMGTSTTVSVIDKEKNFLGGMIIPGICISLDALTMCTSQLPKISLDSPKQIIGSNTADSMKSGVIYGTASSIDGIIDRIEHELGQSCTVIATGGLAHAVVPYCKHAITLDEQLLLKGLMIMYLQNTKD